MGWVIYALLQDGLLEVPPTRDATLASDWYMHVAIWYKGNDMQARLRTGYGMAFQLAEQRA